MKRKKKESFVPTYKTYHQVKKSKVQNGVDSMLQFVFKKGRNRNSCLCIQNETLEGSLRN